MRFRLFGSSSASLIVDGQLQIFSCVSFVWLSFLNLQGQASSDVGTPSGRYSPLAAAKHPPHVALPELSPRVILSLFPPWSQELARTMGNLLSIFLIQNILWMLIWNHTSFCLGTIYLRLLSLTLQKKTLLIFDKRWLSWKEFTGSSCFSETASRCIIFVRLFSFALYMVLIYLQ